MCGIVGKAGVVWPRVGGFKVAFIIYSGPTFIDHHHAPAVGLTRTPPSHHCLADEGCEDHLTQHIPIVSEFPAIRSIPGFTQKRVLP